MFVPNTLSLYNAVPSGTCSTFVNKLNWNISFLVNKNLPFGTLFTALQAEINIAIRINAVTFVKICFNCSKILIQKYIFLWLVKTK